MKLKNEEVEKMSRLVKERNFEECYPIFNSDVGFLELIDKIIESPSELEVRWHATYNWAWLIFLELSGQNFGEKTNFNPTKSQNAFAKFMYSWDRLRRKNIPFELWSDLTEEGLLLLKALINEKKIETYPSDKRYESLMRKFVKRHEDLRMSGKYPDLNELMDD